MLTVLMQVLVFESRPLSSSLYLQATGSFSAVLVCLSSAKSVKACPSLANLHVLDIEHSNTRQWTTDNSISDSGLISDNT